MKATTLIINGDTLDPEKINTRGQSTLYFRRKSYSFSLKSDYKVSDWHQNNYMQVIVGNNHETNFSPYNHPKFSQIIWQQTKIALT